MHVRFPRDGGTAGTRPGVKWYAVRKRLGTTGVSVSHIFYLRIYQTALKVTIVSFDHTQEKIKSDDQLLKLPKTIQPTHLNGSRLLGIKFAYFGQISE